MYRLYRKKWSFFYIFYTFLFGYSMVCLANMDFTLDPNYSVIKRLRCIYFSIYFSETETFHGRTVSANRVTMPV